MSNNLTKHSTVGSSLQPANISWRLRYRPDKLSACCGCPDGANDGQRLRPLLQQAAMVSFNQGEGASSVDFPSLDLLCKHAKSHDVDVDRLCPASQCCDQVLGPAVAAFAAEEGRPLDSQIAGHFARVKNPRGAQSWQGSCIEKHQL